MTNLNHGSVGAVPLPVRHAHQRITDELEADPRGFFKQRVARVTAARAAACEFLDLPLHTTALVKNIATGTAQVLKNLDLAAGDEVITTDHGYGSVGFNVDAYARHDGVVHKVAPVPLNPTETDLIDAVDALITDRTRLVICDHITSATARLFPVAALSRRLRERGVPLLVDAAHAPGHVTPDVAAIGADFWIGNLHKWLFAPRGTAVLSVSEEWAPRMRPLMESWEHESGFPVSTEFNGTDDFTGWLASTAAIGLMRDLGPRRVREHNSRLAQYGQAVLAKALGVGIDDPEPSPLGMRLVRLPEGMGTTQAHTDRIENAIRAELSTELAVCCFNGVGVMRVAAQIYNAPADYERLAERLPGFLETLR
jgi:isopenicillin-N epimerase